MIAKRAASRGTIEPSDSNQDDSRTFKAQQPTGETSRVKLRRQNVIGWGPNASHTMTDVTTQDGKSLRLHCQFKEFHGWVIAPALEHDKRVKEAVASVKTQKPPKPAPKKSVRR
jgi:hypothetical protein